MINEKGYSLIKVNENGKEKYVLEHVWLYELFLGRKLRKGEVIHHKNENKSDNRFDNLLLTTNDEHATIHLQNPARRKQCNECGRLIDKDGNCNSEVCNPRLRNGLFRCGDCKEYLPRDCFQRDKTKKYGIRHNCKTCRSKRGNGNPETLKKIKEEIINYNSSKQANILFNE